MLRLPQRFISTLLAATCVSTTASATDTLTLDRALRELRESPRIEHAQAVADEAKWKRVESYSGFLPKIDALGSYLFDKKYALLDVQFAPGAPVVTFPQIIPNSSAALNAQWTFFDGLANVERWQASKALERSADRDLDRTKMLADRETILLFYRAIATRILKQVAEQNIKTLEDHLHDANLFKRTGLSTNYDVLRVEVQTSEARSELLNAEDNMQVARLRLGEALGKQNEDRQITGTLPLLTAKLIDGIKYEEAKRADLDALRNRAEAYGQLSSAANKFWVPHLGVFGQYQKYNNRNERPFDSEAYRSAYMVGVNMTWNIFDGLVSVARERQSSEQETQAVKTFEIQRVKAATDFEFWKRRYLYNCVVYQSRQSDIEKSTESVRLAREGRKAGVRTNTDLLDAELELFRARAGSVNAQIGAVEALVNLELATGQTLYKFE